MTIDTECVRLERGDNSGDPHVGTQINIVMGHVRRAEFYRGGRLTMLAGYSREGRGGGGGIEYYRYRGMVHSPLSHPP